MRERPSSLPDGRSLSSPSTSTATGVPNAGGCSTAAAKSVVVSAVVHPQTPRPRGHSCTNKVCTCNANFH